MQTLKFRGFRVGFQNRQAAESMIRQADEFPLGDSICGSQSLDAAPLIVDVGANIGIFTLEAKFRWPTARILSIEADPHAFAQLQRNIEINDLPGIRCIHTAVSDRDGSEQLYGEISAVGDSRGNSIDPAWGRRSSSTCVDVPSSRLSNWLGDQSVALLKLDIEGAEQRVLEDFREHLGLVHNLYVEVHETAASRAYNSARGIEQLLCDSGFHVQSEERYARDSLPAHLADWQQQVDACQTQIIAWR